MEAARARLVRCLACRVCDTACPSIRQGRGGVASGQITAETRDFFLDSLEDMALNFAKTLRGLLMVTIEKVWNAVVSVIWKAIPSVTGLALSTPLLSR
jgi:hypothetical protein